MMMFPYTCVVCGGGYKRCGQELHQDQDEECAGGQFCWEDEAVVVGPFKWLHGPKEDKRWINNFIKCKENKQHALYGIYDGRGKVRITNNGVPTMLHLLVVPLEFQGMYKNGIPANTVILTSCKVYCFSCFRSQPSLYTLYTGPITPETTKHAPSFKMSLRSGGRTRLAATL